MTSHNRIFSRQHYCAVSAVLKELTYEFEEAEDGAHVRAKFADLFAADNPNFDRQKFEEAST